MDNINYYRLGDLVYHNYLNREEEDKILKHHPNSLGSKYIIEKRKNNNDDINDTDYRLLIFIKLLFEYLITIIEKIPKDIIQSLLIHLRLGDVVGGNIWYEIGRRPFQINHLNYLIENDNKKGNEYKNRYIIGKCHFGEKCSDNYEESIELSNKYLNNCLELFKAEHLKGEDADFDLCYGILSKNFLQGRGCYSQLIVAIRKRLNLECIDNKDYQNLIQETIDNNNKIQNIYKYSFQSLKKHLNLIKKIYFDDNENDNNDNDNNDNENNNKIIPTLLYITRKGTDINIEEFIEYYLNLGFYNIYIYEIIKDISKYDRKLKKNYPNVKIYILPNNISYNNTIENEIINNYETTILTRNNSTHYLYINDDNEYKIKNYLETNNYTNIYQYMKDNMKDNMNGKRILMTKI